MKDELRDFCTWSETLDVPLLSITRGPYYREASKEQRWNSCSQAVPTPM